MSVMVTSFVVQLQVLSEMRDEIHLLYSAGHFGYQEGYQQRHGFRLDGLPALQEELARLKQEVRTWRGIVARTREQHYFLNYFT